ncbi:hypothetical protein GPJ56_005472 [Histomonas meleagridis]|uniref:uncharacterized protein n=1 Tax=Histomonas meleagridis TaxID=135588 RepID=UPI0035595019|nr:hypothetical protein GPJ56_005472 [Histomonas meleagridis]KAH0802496.1 hypothetical protein GO595_004545 [Histomonas meleagridis]
MNNKDDEKQQDEELEKKNEAKPQGKRTRASRSSSKRAPPPKSGLRKPGLANKNGFESQHTPEQIEMNIIRLYGNLYPQAIIDPGILSDRISVHELRIIVRVLKICTSADLNSLRKPDLCEKLQSYLQSEHMMEVYQNYVKEKEEARQERIRKREERQKQKEELMKKELADLDEEEEPLETIEEEEEKSYQLTKKAVPSRLKIPNKPIEGEKIEIPRLIYDETFDPTAATQFLVTANKFVLEVSERLSEMERAVSIMSRRLAELEKIYM